MPTTALDARDLRCGGRWSLPQRLKNALLRGLIRATLWLADRIPAAGLVACGRGLGALAYRVLPARRHVAIENLGLALPGCDAARVARASFVGLGESLARCLLLRRPSVRALDLIEVDDGARAALTHALDLGRGAVVVSAHLGAFEAIAAAVAELGLRPAVVVRESYDPSLDPVVDAHRLDRGVLVIPRGHPAAATRLVRALREGRPVGVLPDLGGRVPSVAVRFLGRERELPVGPARLARRTGAPLLLATLGPDGAGKPHRLTVQPLPRHADDQTMTQCIADALGAAILAMPQGWPWMAPALPLEKNPVSG